MFEDLLNDFANTFFQSATERLGVRDGEAVVDSFFDRNQNSIPNRSYQSRYKGANFIGSVKFVRAVENEFNVKVEYDDDTAEIHDLGDAALDITLLKCLQRKRRLSNVSNTRAPQEPPKIESKYRRESLH
jgi:hypothetical protein